MSKCFTNIAGRANANGAVDAFSLPLSLAHTHLDPVLDVDEPAVHGMV